MSRRQVISRELTRSRHIDVWLAFYQDFVDERLLSSMRALLSDAERCQEKRFYFADDRQRYLVTRAMVRRCFRAMPGSPRGLGVLGQCLWPA